MLFIICKPLQGTCRQPGWARQPEQAALPRLWAPPCKQLHFPMTQFYGGAILFSSFNAWAGINQRNTPFLGSPTALACAGLHMSGARGTEPSTCQGSVSVLHRSSLQVQLSWKSFSSISRPNLITPLMHTNCYESRSFPLMVRIHPFTFMTMDVRGLQDPGTHWHTGHTLRPQSWSGHMQIPGTTFDLYNSREQ